MSLSIQQIEILMHYRFCLGDVKGVYSDAEVQRAVKSLTDDGYLEANTIKQGEHTVRHSFTKLRLSLNGRQLIDALFEPMSSARSKPTSQESIDQDFERWIKEKHNPGRNLVWPLKEVFKTEYVAYCQGRKDEQL